MAELQASSMGSITGLFTHLCDLYTPEVKRSHMTQPKLSRKQVKTRLKRKLYNTLFAYLKQAEKGDGSEGGKRLKTMEAVKTEIYWYSMRLRYQRRFDDANNLEKLFTSLTSHIDESENSEICAVLQFLLKLKDTGCQATKNVLGHTENKFPKHQNREETSVLPYGPLCYGDTQMIQPDRFHYMHYPRSVFEGEPLQTGNIVTSVCDMLPGSGLSGHGFFSVQGYLNDQHERLTSESLFGGLVQGKITSLNARLEIPELPDDIDPSSRLLELRVPKSDSLMSVSSNDEGFKSQEDSITSTSPDESTLESSFDSMFHSDYDTKIYEDCLSEKISEHYTWETIGLGPGPRTKPFLAEAGPLAFDHWNKAMLTSLKMAFPGITVTPRVEISQPELVKEILNVMIAVPSVNFMLDLTDQCFSVRDGLYVTGISAEALQNLLDDFLTCGMYYYRLDLFSIPPVLDSFYKSGLTYHAFLGAIRNVLQYYRAVVLSIPTTKSLLQLKVLCHKLMKQLRFIASLCQCNDPVTEESMDKFPTGVNLLSYIYRQTLESSFTDHYPLMLSLLQTTSGPYLMFLQSWVYHGVFKDNYSEFMIEVNEDYLHCRDKYYWANGYTLATGKVEDSVPLFVKDLANDIFICGKSINLLKTCNRQHFICQVDDFELPQVTLTFSEAGLQALTVQCQIYASKMQQIARQHAESRREQKERAERAKQDLINKAREVATRELQRLQDKKDELRKAVEAKKKKELQFLKSQMEKDLKRRASEKEEEAEEDRERLDRLLRREEALDEEELELERQAREEVIAYYSQLTEEAARREQKALWKIRRGRLDRARSNFLLQQERQWAADLEKAKNDPTFVPESTPVRAQPAPHTESDKQGLPSWVLRGIDAPTLEVTDDGDEEIPEELQLATEKNLPAWAVKGLQKYAIAEKGRSPRRPDTPSRRRSLDRSVNQESEEQPQKPSIQTYKHIHATKQTETTSPEKKPQIKLLSDCHATSETVSMETYRPTVRQVHERHAAQETKEAEAKPHLRSFEDRHANAPSQEVEHDKVPKLGRTEMNTSMETQSQEWKIKKRSEYGHVSELSGIYTVSVPKLKRSQMMSATKESDYMDYGIKPRIRMNKAMSATKESTPVVEQARPGIKISDRMHSTKESEYVDMDQRRTQMFKERNIYGHAADSTVEKLLYQGKFGKKEEADIQKESTPTVEQSRPGIKISDRMHSTKESEYVDMDQRRTQMFKERNIYGHAADSTVEKLLYQGKFGKKEEADANKDAVSPKIDPSSVLWLDDRVEPYRDCFDFLNEAPRVDLMSSLPGVQYGNYGNTIVLDEVEGHKYLPLPAVIEASITGPLTAQISLVNQSIVTYFLTDLQIDEHFKALRRYLCMADGDFSEILCDLIMDKLATKPRPQDLLNHMFLNNVLNKAIQLSTNSDDKCADNLSFMLKSFPKTLKLMAPDALDCLQLQYDVKWPLNIVITDNSMHKYKQVFTFMLQLKRIVWVLKDVWHRLKRDALVHKAGMSYQFRQIHLYRQEMQHFVKVMQSYISYQIVDVTWQEFQQALAKDVHNLDDLHNVHCQYLDKAIFRCMLNKNAASLMKIVQDIFGLILKFHSQLTTAGWHYNPSTKQIAHANFANMVNTYKVFVEYSGFLFKVVNKLAIRGYQPHLHDLLLRLNFNNYYKT